MPPQRVNVPINNLLDLVIDSHKEKIDVQDLIDGIFALGLLYYIHDKEDKEAIIKKIKEIRGIKEVQNGN
jgi:hypothetical protein